MQEKIIIVGFSFSKGGVLYFCLVLVSILKWWTPLLKYVLVLVLVYQNNTNYKNVFAHKFYYYAYDFNATSTLPFQLPWSEYTNVHAQLNSTWLN